MALGEFSQAALTEFDPISDDPELAELFGMGSGDDFGLDADSVGHMGALVGAGVAGAQYGGPGAGLFTMAATGLGYVLSYLGAIIAGAK